MNVPAERRNDASALVERPQDVPVLVKPFDPAVLLESISAAAVRNGTGAQRRAASE